ncbi:MAG: hypothetical protein ACTH5S_18265, partial [Hafnia alvei]|uniref:hypothetical protein n=1 Tax=Hafnia alvei TaxID=569 RepID=UPI003F8EEBE3
VTHPAIGQDTAAKAKVTRRTPLEQDQKEMNRILRLTFFDARDRLNLVKALFRTKDAEILINEKIINRLPTSKPPHTNRF